MTVSGPIGMFFLVFLFFQLLTIILQCINYLQPDHHHLHPSLQPRDDDSTCPIALKTTTTGNDGTKDKRGLKLLKTRPVCFLKTFFLALLTFFSQFNYYCGTTTTTTATTTTTTATNTSTTTKTRTTTTTTTNAGQKDTATTTTRVTTKPATQHFTVQQHSSYSRHAQYVF
jgi:hypothetical protein